MELSSTKSHERVTLRFFADFDIQVRSNEIEGLTPEQINLIQAILRSSIIKRRLAQMALETDLSAITGSHLDELFQGPSIVEILELVQNSLNSEDRPYWDALRIEGGDALHNEIMPVFLAFDVILRRAGLEELSEAAAEPIRKTVGPTVDASSL